MIDCVQAPLTVLHTLPQPKDPEIIPLKAELPQVPAFDVELLPAQLKDWLCDIQERMQCPMDFLAVGAMVSIAGVVGGKALINPKQKDDWIVTPNLWGAMIGRPSIMKTPALNEVLKPIKQLSKEAEDEFQQRQIDFEVERFCIEQRKKLLEAEVTKALKLKGDDAWAKVQLAKQNLKDLREEEAQTLPCERRYIVNDATVEALGVRLNENPNGLILVRDELAGWIRGLDREDKSNDRTFYLECFNGNGSYTYDRIGRGTIKIESTILSIIGGIQPSVLQPYVSQTVRNGTGNDGLIQRFQLAVYPDDPKDWKNVDRYPNKEARERAYEFFYALNELEPLLDEDGNATGLKFDAQGQAVFNKWFEELHRKTQSDYIAPVMEMHLAKYRSLMPSMALLLELANNPMAESVGADSAQRAIKWCNYLEAHALRIYHGALDQSTVSAKMIFDRRNKLGDKFKVKDIQQKGWSGLTDTDAVKSALSVLVEHGYLIQEVEPTNGRNAINYRWNRNLKNSENS